MNKKLDEAKLEQIEWIRRTSIAEAKLTEIEKWAENELARTGDETINDCANAVLAIIREEDSPDSKFLDDVPIKTYTWKPTLKQRVFGITSCHRQIYEDGTVAIGHTCKGRSPFIYKLLVRFIGHPY